MSANDIARGFEPTIAELYNDCSRRYRHPDRRRGWDHLRPDVRGRAIPSRDRIAPWAAAASVELVSRTPLSIWGLSPLCEKYVAPDRLDEAEQVYPLHAWICRQCLLVQLEAVVTPEELFDDYAYFSSYSDSWVAHARAYCDDVIQRFNLGANSRIVEIASNDGYLLQHFVARGLRVLGIEPAANVARVAEARGIPTK